MSAGNPTYHTISDLKSRFLNIAQTSIYHVKFGVPTNVASFLGSRNINFGDISNIELLCSETSLPGSTLATHEVTNDYHGVTEKMAYRRIYDETIDLTFYVDRDYRVIEFFDSWMDYITGGGTTFTRENYKERYVHYRMNYPTLYKSDIFILKYEKNYGTSMKYSFINAFPINVISTPVSYDQSQLLKCTVSFSYIRYVRERIGTSAVEAIPDPKSPGVVEFNKFDFWKRNPLEKEFDINKWVNKYDFPEYYNNGIDRQIRNGNIDFIQAPGDIRQDNTNFGRGIA